MGARRPLAHDANHDYQAPLGPYGYDPNLATTRATGPSWPGTPARPDTSACRSRTWRADGAPVGGAATMPNTSDMQVGMLGRTPLVARKGGGFYVAYPTGYPRSDRVRLWRVGAPPRRWSGARGSSSPAVAVAAAGDGRLWVVWTEGFGDPDVLARRSNKSATRFGATVNAGHPKDALQAYKVDASATGGALDVLGNFNIDTSANAVTSYRRLLPGLTLQARPGKLRKGERTDRALHRERRGRRGEGREGQGRRRVGHDQRQGQRDADDQVRQGGEGVGDALGLHARDEAAQGARLTRRSAADVHARPLALGRRRRPSADDAEAVGGRRGIGVAEPVGGADPKPVVTGFEVLDLVRRRASLPAALVELAFEGRVGLGGTEPESDRLADGSWPADGA